MTLRRQDGFTYIEVLIVLTLSLVILGATLAVFNAMELKTKRNQTQNDGQQSARNGIESLTLRLRNLASPVPAGGAIVQPIELAMPQDLVFRSVKPTGTVTGANAFNVQRERYCLDNQQRLWRQTQTWTGVDPALPTTACGAGWTTSRVVGEHVVNGARPLFSYVMSDAAGVTEQSNVGAAAYPDVQGIRAHLFVDVDEAVAPVESEITTRVFLRNQNRVPVASFTAVCGSNRQVVLNGSASADPEAGALTFAWYDGATKLGAGVTYTTSSLSVGSHSLSLKVTDSGDLTVSAPARAVTINATGSNLPSCTVS